MHFVSRQVGRPTFTDPYSFPRFIKEKTPVCGGVALEGAGFSHRSKTIHFVYSVLD